MNGSGSLTFEDARTWLEETGLCLFQPRKQYTASLAPSFVEAVAGHRIPNPDAKQVALAEDLLVRLEKDDIAVRLNLLGQPGEAPDFIVAAWVLPYVYALRGDRDWRRIPQLTGSRQVSPLAVQTYKLLEASESTIPQLKHALGREVSESAVIRAITELWQQLRIIPVTEAPGKTPRWQLLRTRYQKAIAEGASTSQVTAISVLASIYLQAVIAASMEDVELFLAPLTARSKVREVLRGLVATRQVHTIALGHAPHFYVAGTLPEFTPPPTVYASAAMPASSYFLHSYEGEEEPQEAHIPAIAAESAEQHQASEAHVPVQRKPAPPAKPHFSRPSTVHARDRKPSQSGSNGRLARRSSTEARGPRWASTAAKSSNHGSAKHDGTHTSAATAHRTHSNGSVRAAGSNGHKAATVAHGNHTIGKTASSARNSRRVVAAGARSGGKRVAFSGSARRQGTKKRG